MARASGDATRAIWHRRGNRRGRRAGCARVGVGTDGAASRAGRPDVPAPLPCRCECPLRAVGRERDGGEGACLLRVTISEYRFRSSGGRSVPSARFVSSGEYRKLAATDTARRVSCHFLPTPPWPVMCEKRGALGPIDMRTLVMSLTSSMICAACLRCNCCCRSCRSSSSFSSLPRIVSTSSSLAFARMDIRLARMLRTSEVSLPPFDS